MYKKLKWRSKRSQENINCLEWVSWKKLLLRKTSYGNSSQAPPEHPRGLLYAAEDLELPARDEAPEGHIMLDKLLIQHNFKLPLMLQRRTEIHIIFSLLSYGIRSKDWIITAIH